MCGTPGVRKGRQSISENLRNTYQIFPIHFVCQLMLVENLATNTGTETQQSQISWWTALRKALQAIASIVQHAQFHSQFQSNSTAEKEFQLHHCTNLPKSV